MSGSFRESSVEDSRRYIMPCALTHAARQPGYVQERAANLDTACAGNPELRRRIERPLQAGERAKEFIDHRAANPMEELSPTLLMSSGPEAPGRVIGRYRLLEQIGEGGCGVVSMAEQEEPVRRRVAPKVIKLDTDTRSVIARFESERQALAIMDHPNIARVFDAGAVGAEGAESQIPDLKSEIRLGRPYFVTEPVRGIKTTDYCVRDKLSTKERLGLSIQVCHAIQHAHQKVSSTVTSSLPTYWSHCMMACRYPS